MTGLTLRCTGFFVEDVPKTLSFYQAAFGLNLRYLHPSTGYAEVETGETLLAFVSEQFIDEASLLGGSPFRTNRHDTAPIAAWIAFVTADMEGDWQRALAAGATVVKLPEAKPWGQVVGYLRDLNGVIVELCTKSPRG